MQSGCYFWKILTNNGMGQQILVHIANNSLSQKAFRLESHCCTQTDGRTDERTHQKLVCAFRDIFAKASDFDDCQIWIWIRSKARSDDTLKFHTHIFCTFFGLFAVNIFGAFRCKHFRAFRCKHFGSSEESAALCRNWWPFRTFHLLCTFRRPVGHTNRISLHFFMLLYQ